ncbi:MAG: hypothetical protein K5765_09410, partial [Clostridia bacterium]|nr:hypothetical protein [Clostridia bacterium]
MKLFNKIIILIVILSMFLTVLTGCFFTSNTNTSSNNKKKSEKKIEDDNSKDTDNNQNEEEQKNNDDIVVSISNRNWFDEDRTYLLTELNISLWGLDFITTLIDKDKTCATFSKDGFFELKAYIDKTLLAALKLAAVAASAGKEVNSSMFEDIDFKNFNLSNYVEDYSEIINTLLPSENIYDFKNLLYRLYEDFGLSIEGINKDSQTLLEFLQNVKDNPSDVNLLKLIVNITNDTYISLKLPYNLFDLQSVNEDIIKAIYIGDFDSPTDDPYIIITRLFDDETNTESIKIINKVIRLNIL